MEEYRRKRDFKATPEPEPGGASAGRATAIGPSAGAASTAGNRFVIHRHEARNLHYDLRIEAGSVLACWAVPRGFSYAPADKRLAVRTEDHPLEYTEFSGTIPRGSYGAGTMKIWDEGEYAVRKSPTIGAALEKGELKLELKGRRLRGEWHMVLTKSGRGNEWLLFKARDRYAGSGTDLFGAADMSLAARKPMPRGVAPMRPSPGDAPFNDPDWFFEPELSGRRVTVRIQEGVATIRAGTEDLTGSLPDIVNALGSFRASDAIMDGIIVENGALLYVFDIMYAEEWDLRRLALRERKAVVKALVPDGKRVFPLDPVVERGGALAAAAAESGLAAIIAKRADSVYKSGVSEDWRLIPVKGTPGVAVTSSGSRGAAKKPAPRKAPAAPLVTITHPRKMYWPEQGYTKGDLVAYYDRVATWILPYLRDRPLHLYRWPDGIHGKSFYQKQLPPDLLEGVETVNVADEGEEPILYAMCNDRKTLLTLINSGSIDLHPWMSRKDSLDSPDWSILDLDPKGAPFSNVMKIARTVGRVLRGLGIEPYLKTSGSSGLHVFIPLAPGYTYTQSRMFCEAVARMVVRDHSDIATVQRVVNQREGRVYVDFLQNRREQTVVPPYVVRPVDGATVSMPLEWDELEGPLSISDFTLGNAPARIERNGDLFRTALARPQDLAAAISELERHVRS